ncbi:MAG: radical SAM protein, partial [Planctomycetota bacterium]
MAPPLRPELDVLDAAVLADVVAGELRISPEQALRLYHEMPIQDLGRWADARCRRVHGPTIRTYVIDRNINYTNICTARCTFCAFRRDGDEADAYTLEYEALLGKIEAMVAIGGTQILMQGGMNPHLPLRWYVELLEAIKARFPHLHVHAFSPPEFFEFVRFFDPPGATLEAKLRWVMRRLQVAGLDSVPGGGGEIFAPAVRSKIGLGKGDADAWLTTMRVAHELGMNTSATMMFGHIEGIADRIHHMELVRTWPSSPGPFSVRTRRSVAARSGARSRAMICQTSFRAMRWPGSTAPVPSRS